MTDAPHELHALAEEWRRALRRRRLTIAGLVLGEAVLVLAAMAAGAAIVVTLG